MNGTGKKFNLQSVLLGLTLLFLLVDRLILPGLVSANLVQQVNANTKEASELRQQVQYQALDIAMLKECIIALRPLPTQVAAIEAMLKTHMKEK